MSKLTIGAVLKQRGLSKRQLAIRMGIRYENVFRFFRPGFDPKLSTLAKIAKAIGCKIRDLIKE